MRPDESLSLSSDSDPEMDKTGDSSLLKRLYGSKVQRQKQLIIEQFRGSKDLKTNLKPSKIDFFNQVEIELEETAAYRKKVQQVLPEASNQVNKTPEPTKVDEQNELKT